jgi:hypothetical protein
VIIVAIRLLFFVVLQWTCNTVADAFALPWRFSFSRLLKPNLFLLFFSEFLLFGIWQGTYMDLKGGCVDFARDTITTCLLPHQFSNLNLPSQATAAILPPPLAPHILMDWYVFAATAPSPFCGPHHFGLAHMYNPSHANGGK